MISCSNTAMFQEYLIPIILTELKRFFARCKFSVLKKVKHRIVENMSSSTADSLGLSRAILCNGMVYYFNW